MESESIRVARLVTDGAQWERWRLYVGRRRGRVLGRKRGKKRSDAGVTSRSPKETKRRRGGISRGRIDEGLVRKMDGRRRE